MSTATKRRGKPPSEAERAERRAAERAAGCGGDRGPAVERGLGALAARPPPLPHLQPPQPAADRPPVPGGDPRRRLSRLARASATACARARRRCGSGLRCRPPRRRSSGGRKKAPIPPTRRGPSSAWSRSSTAPRSSRCPSTPAARRRWSRRTSRSRARGSPARSRRSARSPTALGAEVSFEPIPGSARGYHEPATGRIVVDSDPGLSANARSRSWSTSSHTPWSAATAARATRSLSYSEEEVVVEAVAYCVCAGLGLDTGGAAVPYVAGWGGERAADQVEAYAALIDRLARRIEEAIEADLGPLGRGCCDPEPRPPQLGPPCTAKAGASELRISAAGNWQLVLRREGERQWQLACSGDLSGGAPSRGAAPERDPLGLRQAADRHRGSPCRVGDQEAPTSPADQPGQPPRSKPTRVFSKRELMKTVWAMTGSLPAPSTPT